jgi:hypothetical protein
MTCNQCDSQTVRFEVPESLRTYAPSGGAHAALCTHCLRTQAAADGPADPSFDSVHDSVPGGEGGVALALALGLLGSLALNRAAITALCEYAERHGVDVLLALDRIAEVSDVDPHFDVARRRTQLAQLLS